MSDPLSGGSITIQNGNYPSDLGHLLPSYEHFHAGNRGWELGEGQEVCCSYRSEYFTCQLDAYTFLNNKTHFSLVR